MCLRLIETAGDMRLVFHRAFDCVTDQERNWSILKELGIQNILSSGAANTAIEGAEQFSPVGAKRIQKFNSWLAQVSTRKNVAALIDQTGVAAVTHHVAVQCRAAPLLAR